VFRAALCWIVLTLAAGQDAGFLCQALCRNGAAAECQHHGSTTLPSVSAQDGCRSIDAGAVAFVREDARRTAAAPDAQNVPLVPRFRLTASRTDLPLGFGSGRRLPIERPLALPLRL